VTDTALADAVATLGTQRVADRIPILFTPVQWLGHSPMHLNSFGGTLSHPVEQLINVLEGTGRTGLDNGFDGLVIPNGHGGELETSLMLHLYPEVVRKEVVDEQDWERRDMAYQHAAPDMTESGRINVYQSSDRYSTSGVEGDPTAATAAAGAEIYDRIGDELETLFEDLHAVVTDEDPKS